MKKIILLLLTVCLAAISPDDAFCNMGRGDEVPKKAQKLFEKSGEQVLSGNLEEAIELLNKAVDVYPKYMKAYLQLAELHTKLEQYEEAKKAYQKILSLKENPANQFMVNMKIGDLNMLQHDYKAAIKNYEVCEKIEVPVKWKPRVEHVKFGLAKSRFILKAKNDPVPFSPTRMNSDVNSSIDEYLPIVTADESTLVFTRRTPGDRQLEDFYTSSRDTSGIWKAARLLGKPLNTDANEGAISISPDGKRLFFAAKDRPKGMGGFDIYYCIREGDSWKGPYNMGEPINTRFWDSQPCISADGKSLYFVSRRRGGKGGTDIWVSYLNDDFYWEEPINLGGSINTDGDEQTPFIHPDGETLYFSSNGHIGMGDADLYVVRKDENGDWGKPENLGYPINDEGNQNGLIVTPSGERAYYSALTDSAGLDIFYFDLPKPAKPKVFVTYVKGTVKDAETEEWLNANIELIDLETGETLYETSSDPMDGSFLVTLPAGKNYMYNVSKHDYLFHSENFSLKERNPEEPYVLDVGLIPIQEVVVETVPAIEEPKPEPIPEPTPEPTPVPEPTPPPVVEEKPIVIEKPPVIIREEPIIIKEPTPPPVIIKEEPKPVPPPVIVEEPKPAPPPPIIVDEPKPTPPPAPSYSSGESVVMKNVFFATNSFELESVSFIELDRLVSLLNEHPNLRIEIGGHTDNTGKASYNMTLSQKRAKSVYDYLIGKGISASRLAYRGYGDTMPIMDNDTEFGRGQNRRTEFTIISK